MLERKDPNSLIAEEKPSLSGEQIDQAGQQIAKLLEAGEFLRAFLALSKLSEGAGNLPEGFDQMIKESFKGNLLVCAREGKSFGTGLMQIKKFGWEMMRESFNEVLENCAKKINLAAFVGLAEIYSTYIDESDLKKIIDDNPEFVESVIHSIRPNTIERMEFDEDGHWNGYSEFESEYGKGPDTYKPVPVLGKYIDFSKVIDESFDHVCRFGDPASQSKGWEYLKNLINGIGEEVENENYKKYLNAIFQSYYSGKGAEDEFSSGGRRPSLSYIDYEKVVKELSAVNFPKNVIIDGIRGRCVAELTKQTYSGGRAEIKKEFEDFGLQKDDYRDIIEEAIISSLSLDTTHANDLVRDFDISVEDVDLKKHFFSFLERKAWKEAGNMKRAFTESEKWFEEFFASRKEIASDIQKPFAERQQAFDALAGIAMSLDESLAAEFAKIIAARSRQKDVPESKWGLDPTQEAAFFTLSRLDNPDANSALFSLLFNDNVSKTVKFASLRTLTRENRNFLTANSRSMLREWFRSEKNKEDLDWQDLRFINSILNNIPSAELRNKSIEGIDNEGVELSQLNQLWQSQYKNIPENAFLQIWKFVDGDEALLNKFGGLYDSIRKDSTQKENLLYDIISGNEMHPEISETLMVKLKEIDFGSDQDAHQLSDLFRKLVFLDKIDDIINYSGSYEEADYDWDDAYFDNSHYTFENEKKEGKLEYSGLIKILQQPTGDLGKLNDLLRGFINNRIQEVLPDSNITGEKIEGIEKAWGDVEPIFTYLMRYPSLKNYIAQMAVNFDDADNWKKWRYDPEQETVKDQIGHLSDEQRVIWTNDHFSELGDIMIAGSEGNKPEQIRGILRDAVLTHRHIFDPSRGSNKNAFIQKTLLDAFGQISESAEQTKEIFEKKVEETLLDSSRIDAIIQSNGIPRLNQILQYIFPEGSLFRPSKKAKDSIDFVSQYLPTDVSLSLLENYNQAEQQEQSFSDAVFTEETRKTLKERMVEIATDFQNALDSDIWKRMNLDKNNLKDVGQFYQKRQELKATADLLRLCNLSNKLIATNKIIDKEGKKTGESLMGVVNNLKKYFAGSPLLQDINNIEFSLKERVVSTEKRRLAIIFTDNPQMLWQVGKYPIGCGSCQHYADGSYAENLMGYVGDANCRAMYLVDLNKLPEEEKNKLKEKGFEEVKDKIKPQSLLGASIGRSIVKMCMDADGQPVVLLEPTYSVFYKEDTTMDKYLNLFADLIIAEPMKAKMARGEGQESIKKGSSRSPKGQYEDLDLSRVKFIHKLSKPTKEEESIMERVRSSS